MLLNINGEQINFLVGKHPKIDDPVDTRVMNRYQVIGALFALREHPHMTSDFRVGR